jgi:tetratricopeptide (TPR) repeat protein
LSLDDFRYDHRVSHIEIHDNEATVVIFQEIDFTQYDRNISEGTWLTVQLREGGGRWIIAAEEERVYAKPIFTDLSIELDPEQATIDGKAIIEFEIMEPHEDNVVLSLNRGLNVTSLTGKDDAELAYERRNLAIIVPWQTSFSEKDKCSITVDFRGSFFNETEELGYSQVNIGPQGSFASWVTDWYPRLSTGISKSKGRISYLVPHGTTVASSGALVKKETVDDKVLHVFDVNAPLDYSFGAANYFHHEESVDDIAIGVYFLKGGIDKASLYVNKCAEIIRYLKQLYGMYPYDSYSIVELPSDVTGNLGGSSEQGMNLYPVGTLAEDKFNLPLFAHEIGHSWWGNWVKSADFTIIDEGLAQMTAVFCVQEFMGEETMRDFLKNGFSDYPQSASMYFQSINVGDLELGIPRIGKEAALHRLADTKGHFVYNMLRETIGHDAFVTALRNTIRQYAMTRIDLRALIKEFENTSGKDLKGFFDQWFYRRGAPEFRFNYEIEPRNGDFGIRGELIQLRDIYAVEAEISLVHEKEKEIRKITIADEAVTFDFLVPFRPDTVLFDPDYKILRWTDEFRYLPLFGEGVNLRVSGRNEEAIEKLVQFLDEMPNHMEGHYQIARAYQNIDNLEEARQHYERVVESYEASKKYHWSVSWSYVRLAQIHDAMGQPEKVRALCDRVLSLPDVMGAHGEVRKYLEGE